VPKKELLAQREEKAAKAREEIARKEAAKQESLNAEKPKAGPSVGTHVPPTSVSADEAADVREAKVPTSTSASNTSPSASASGTSTPSRYAIPNRPALTQRSDLDIRTDAGTVTEDEKKKKKAGMTTAQREQLAAFEAERTRIRKERVDTLAAKLKNRISIWTETDKGDQVRRTWRQSPTQPLKSNHFQQSLSLTYPR